MSNELILAGAKGGGDEPHTPVEARNTLLSVSYAKVLIAVGEGTLAGNPTGKDIYLNGTPLINEAGESNFGGVTWEWRNGSQDQTYIQGMPETSNETSVGVEVTQLNSWTQTLTKKALSAARVTLNWPALMQQHENGDTTGYSISYALEIATDGGPFVIDQEHVVSGKTNTEYERTHVIKLPRNPKSGWTIRVRRLTPNSESSLIQDTMKVKSFTEVVDMKSSYPNTALLFVQFDSRLFGGGQIPTISVETRGRVIRVPENYDADQRTYTGVWNGAFKWSWTDNPAWVFFDILTQERFGLGARVDVTQVDKWALYELAQYCDVMLDDGTGAGTKAPRHTCNIFIQSQADAWTVLRDLTTIFNGMTYWNGKQFAVLADRQEDIRNIPLYSRANVINGKFKYQTTDERSIFTSALVSYDDPTNHYGTEVEAVWEKAEILRWGGDRQTTVSAIGCTSRAEAQRRGKYQLLTNMYNKSTTFQTGLQALAARSQPGNIIAVADPIIAGKPFTGRLVGGTDTVVTLDRDAEVNPGDVMFITNSLGIQQGRTVKSVHGRVVEVTAKYSETPKGNDVWYLESATLKSQLFRVTKITSPEEGIYEISGVEYNDSKYGAIDEGARLEPRPVSVVPDRIQEAPSPVTITAGSYVEQTMALTVMTITWPQTKFAVSYEAQWRVGLGDWVPLGTTGANTIDVKGVYAGKYFARVRAINAMGTKSVWSTSLETNIVGKEGTPNALASLTTSSEIFGIGIHWKFKPGSEDTAYIDIQESTSASGADPRPLTTVAYPADNYLKSGLAAGVQFFYRARLIDRTGNIGPYTGWVRGSSSADADEILDYIKGQIDETSISKELNDRIDKIEVIEVEVGDLAKDVERVEGDIVRIDGDVTNIKVDVSGLHKDVEQLDKDIQGVEGSVNWLESQVSGIENQLQNDISTVNKNLGDAIEQTNNDVADLKEDVTELNTVVDALQDQVSNFVDALEYDPSKSYRKGESVREGQNLYQAIKDVPAGVSPPNAEYWKDVGDIITDLGALASQVNTNTTTITKQGDTITAQGQKLDAIEIRMGSAESKISGNSSAIQNLQSTVTQQGKDISTNSQAITALKGSVQNLETGQAGNASAIESLKTTVETQGDKITSQGQQLTSLGAEVKALQTDVSGVKSEVEAQGTAITGLTTTVTQQGDTIKSHSNSITSLESSVGKITTDLSGLTTKVDANTSAVSNLTSTVTQQGKDITAQGRDITTLKADVTSVTTDVNGLKTTVTAQGTAISNLETKVTKQGNDIASISTDVTKLTSDLKLVELEMLYDKAETDQQIGDALVIAEGAASATQSLTSEVTKQGEVITAQAQRLTELEASLTDIDGNVVGFGSAIESLKTTVTSQGNTITSQGQAITTLNNSITVVEGKADKAQADATDALTQVSTKADASAVQSLTQRVSNAEGKITSQGESITKLDNSLTITNQNVTAAQNAAQAASDKAGAKGEVIYGTSSPAADKRLPQNLWIDTTNGNNTPKRWNGNAWVEVTDKVAKDAAAAAAEALSVANTKADASALQSLTTRVTSAEGKITSQGESITSLNNSLTITNGKVADAQKTADEAKALAETKADSSALQSLTNTVTQQDGKITAQGQAITNLTASLKTTDDKVNLKADASTVTALTNTVTQQGKDIAANTSSLTSLKTEVQFQELDSLYDGAETDQQITDVFNIASGAASATQELKSSVETIEGVITAQGESITELKASLDGIDVNAVGQAVESLKVIVTSQGNTITSQGQAITQLDNSLTITDQKATDAGKKADEALTKVDTKADASAVQSLTNRVTSVEGSVTSQGQAITQLNNSVTRVEGKADKAQSDATKAQGDADKALQQITTKADASALNSLTTRVTDAEGKITSQGQSITQLNNSLVITNDNVTAAQKAAQDASDKAGAKGEVIYGNSAPSADKRLPQNLWIDTTAGANTPKRWTGNAWVEVTDKVAKDAAAAAADALSKVEGKADASALQALSNTVTQQGKDITSNANSITKLDTSIQFQELDSLYAEETEGMLADAYNIASGAASANESLKSEVTQQGNLLTAQAAKIVDLESSLSNVEGEVVASGTAIANLKTVTTAQGNSISSMGQDIVTLNNSLTITNGKVDDALQKITLKADASALNSLSTKVDSIDGKVTAQGNAITQLTSRVTNTETGVTANATAISKVETKVTDIDGQLTTVSTRVDGVYAQVNPELAGGEGLAGDSTSLVGVWSEQSARIEGDVALGEKVDNVQVEVNDTRAAVQQVSRAQVDLDGKASAMWAVKLQVTQNGEYKYAGIGLGLENGPGGLQSTFIVDADKFAIGQGDVIPFAVQGGQTFIKSAFIQEASITMLQIGDNLQSTDYVAGTSGWKLSKGGNIEFNGSVAGGGRLTMSNKTIQVYDENNVLRVRLGLW